MSKKKTRMKHSTLGLVIICVLLVAALGGIITYYTIKINADNNNLNNLLTFIGIWTTPQYPYTSSEVNTAITDLNGTLNELSLLATADGSTINSLNAILNLDNSTIWVNNETVSEPAGGVSIAWYNWTFSASYAGYVTIDVTSASAGAWAQTEYSAYGVNYSNQTNVGTNGTASFPILPSSNITVGVGNQNLSAEATQTVTITYYY